MVAKPIFHLDDATSWRGGEQQVLYLHRGLLVKGRDSRVLCREGSALHQRLQRERLPHDALRLGGLLGAAHDLSSAWRIGQLVRRERGLLHAHSSHSHDLALWASRLNGPAASSFPVIVSRRVDFPVGRSLPGRRKYRDRRVRMYLAISSAVERELRAAGIEAERIRRVPSGIDLGRFEDLEPDRAWRAGLGLAPGELLWGNVAALAPHKDQATLLKAFALYRRGGGRGHLVILGEGELRGRLEAQVRELQLSDCVHLPGFSARVLERMATLDVFVLSSYLEGLGTAILDAMALALPVLATRTGGIPDAVIDGRTGLLVPPRDPGALAAAMRRLQERPELRRELARSGRTHVGSFDVERTVELTLAAYGELE